MMLCILWCSQLESAPGLASGMDNLGRAQEILEWSNPHHLFRILACSLQFLLSIQGTNWFQGTISTVDLDYEICCPYSSLGCRHICLRTELDKHLAKDCQFNKEPESSDSIALVSGNRNHDDGDVWTT